jgi:hypothetical protein
MNELNTMNKFKLTLEECARYIDTKWRSNGFHEVTNVHHKIFLLKLFAEYLFLRQLPRIPLVRVK